MTLRNTLRITAIEARDLPPMKSSKLMVQVRAGNVTRKINISSSSPVWNEDLDLGPLEPSTVISFSLYRCRAVFPNKLLSKYQLPLQDFVFYKNDVTLIPIFAVRQSSTLIIHYADTGLTTFGGGTDVRSTTGGPNMPSTSMANTVAGVDQPSPTTPFKLLFVPDPTRISPAAKGNKTLAYLETRLNRREMDSLRNIYGAGVDLLSRRLSLKGYTYLVRIQDWVYTTVCMQRYDSGQRFRVEYLTWERFFNALMNPASHPNDYNTLINTDCLIGGADYTVAYLNPRYNINAGNVRQYRRNIRQLSSTILIWPDPQQIEKLASKVTLISHLDQVAMTVTKSFRPTTEQLFPGQPIPIGTVLKRTNSDCGLHVLFPESTNRNWEYLRKHSEIDGSLWLSQTYVPSLRRLGEWRVLLVGGQIMYIVHTCYQEHLQTWTSEPAHNFFSLKVLSQKAAKGHLLHAKNIGMPDGNKQEREWAHDEFLTFVQKTYEGLYEIEALEMAGKPSISVFCRFDIGLIVDQHNNVHYFVNEVESTHTTSMWSHGQKVDIGKLGDTFAMVLYQWIEEMKISHVQ